MAYLYPAGVSITTLIVVGLCTFQWGQGAIWQLMRDVDSRYALSRRGRSVQCMRLTLKRNKRFAPEVQ